VFSTHDPDIRWNGTLDNTGAPVPDGVYFYVCKVFFKRLNGAVPEVLKGTLQITGGNHAQHN